jgi:hypothetical protein
VAIGPGGVFLLDSKRWRGSVTVEGDSAVVRRLEDPDLYWRFTSPARIKGLAVKVSQAIRAGTRATVWVTPVIVVWGEFAQVVGGRHMQVRSWRRARAVAQGPAGADRPRPGGTNR